MRSIPAGCASPARGIGAICRPPVHREHAVAAPCRSAQLHYRGKGLLPPPLPCDPLLVIFGSGSTLRC